MHALLTSARGGGEWSASRPGHFTPRERALGMHWIAGWVGPRAGLDVAMKRKLNVLYIDIHILEKVICNIL
jgi:hypothetical protein